MYEIIKNICTANGFHFEYARRDFANLFNEEDDRDKVYVFLDPVVIDTTFDDYGNPTNTTYSGNMMVLKSSDFDEGYEERYIDDIKPIIEEKTKVIFDAIACTQMNINNWRTVEVVNMMDWNFDGVVITYNITE